jgi:hypothetical protein
MILNFSKIRTLKKDNPVAKHFLQNNHTKDNLKVIGIEKVLGTEIYRKVKESFWMKTRKLQQSCERSRLKKKT